MPALPIASEDVKVGPALAADNARGNDFSTAEGQAIENVGQQGSRLAADANRIHLMTVNADAIGRAAKTASDSHLALTQYAEDLKSRVPNDASGYTDQLLSKIDDTASQAISAEPNVRGQKILAEHFANIKNAMGQQAIAWQSATQRSTRIQNLNDSIDQNSQMLEGNPGNYQDSLKTMTDTINQLDSTLHPTDRTALAAKAKQSLMEGASRGFIRANPQVALQTLTGSTPQPPNSIPAKITSAADSAGIDGHVPLAISYLETGGKLDPNAQNPKSTAHGLFQQLDSTAEQYMPGADHNDPDVQVTGGVKQVADYQKKLGSMLGRTPNPTEVYSAHLLGPGGAAALARADPNMPMIDLVNQYDPKNAAKTVNDNGFTGKTVGQVKTQLNQWMTNAMQKTAGMANAPTTPEEADAAPAKLPPFFADATPAERDAFIAHAQALVNKKDSDAKVEIEGKFQDFKTNMAIGNDAPPVALNDFVNAYGHAKGIAMYQDQQQWQQYGHDYGSMKTGTFEQNEALVDARKPPDGAPAEQIMRYESLKRVRDDINQQRAAQPLESAAASGAYQLHPIDFSDPTKLADQIKARTLVAGKVASDYGTPLTVFTHNETAGLSQAIQNAPTSQVASILKGIKQGSPDARTYQTALGQIAGDHSVPAVAGAIMEKQQPIQMSPGGMFSQPTSQSQEDVATTMLDGWRAMNPVKGAKETEGKAMRLPLPKNGELETEFAAQVGSTFGTDSKSYNAAFDAAKAYYVGSAMKGNQLGEEWSNDKKQLFDKGITAATGGIVDFNGRGKVSPPWGMPADKFNDAMSRAIPAAVSAAGGEPTDFPAGRQQLAQIGDGRYALVSGTGLAVGKNKQPIIVDLNQAPAPVSNPATAAPNKGKKTDVDLDRMIK